MKRFIDLKISVKLLSGFVAVALIAGMIGLFGVSRVRSIQAAGREMFVQTKAVELIGSLSTNFQRLRSNLRDLILADSAQEINNYQQRVHEFQNKITDISADYEKTLTDVEDRKLYKEFQDSMAVYMPLQKRIETLAIANNDVEAIALLKGDAGKAAHGLMAVIERMVAAEVQAAVQLGKQNDAIANKAVIVTVALTAAGMLLAIVLGFLIAGRISRPMNNLALQAKRVAEGDLEFQVVQESQDEIGQLTGAFALMVHNLRQIIGKVKETSESLSSAASQLSSASDQMATGAEEVACQTGTVATASEQMAATSGEIAQNCLYAADGSRQANDKAVAGVAVVKETVAVMDRIARCVRSSADTVESLGVRSNQIGNIIGTIEDIADQTNLLALNAAIEAARAGEQGRGFAVVADEVRALAERTTRATREISEMIKSIQKETSGAVTAMNEGVSEVKKGTLEASRSGEALQEILNQIESVTTQVNQIATAAEEQTATTGEITTNIQQITDVVNETARGAQESAIAANQLTSLAHELKSLVGQFQLAA
jgi:methyl-accepting chemotaxis protein